jgi:hypothetical protein
MFKIHKRIKKRRCLKFKPRLPLHHLVYLLQSGGFIDALGKLSLEDENEISIHPKNCIDKYTSDAIMDDLNSDEGNYFFQKLRCIQRI